MSSPEQLGSQGQSSRNSTTSWLSCSIISASILTGLLGIAWASQTQQLLQLAIEKPSSECRCMSGDECWPSADEWSRFNASVNGRLITTLPIGAPCHDPTYNAEKCESLRQQWQSPSLHDASSHSIMAPFFANRSCDVWTPREWPCEMGNYVTYSLNVSESSQIVKGLAFAKEKNIRLVIRNTGHDYLGKSTGAGALAIWTHHLKDISIFDYKDAYYQGKAMKMGAGVQGFEAYKSADCHGLAVVGGECPSVGLAGGYTQGGGHSALSSMYGLGADQTLEFEVIDGSVNFLRASRAENEDLYWALSGGGGSTFGIVYSMTVKAHPDIPMTGARLAFQKRNGEDAAFWGAIEYYHSIAHTMSEVGGTTVCMFTSGTFDIMPLTVPGLSVSSVRSLLTPLTEKLSQLGIPYNIEVRQYPGFLQQHYAMFDFIAVGIAQYGGWLIPQSVIDSKNSELTSALREIVEDGNVVFGIGLNVSHAVTKGVYNSVHPAWRQAGLSAVVAAPWNESATWEDRIWQTKKMTEEWIPKLERIAPDSGCYMNEGDFQQKGWKKAFFGPNYEKLLTIKNRYDPDHIFYAINAVGSDFWKVEADGRLCPA